MLSKNQVLKSVQDTIDRLEYFQHLQQATCIPLLSSSPSTIHNQHSSRETLQTQQQSFWYLGSFNISSSKLANLNKYFNQLVFDEDFYDIAIKLGSISFKTSLDLQLSLYHVNETLSRLFKNQDKTQDNVLQNTPERGKFIKTYDTDLIMMSVIDLIISKLSDLLITIQNISNIDPVSVGLVENITKKILRGRILQPYHEMILNEVEDFVDHDVSLYFQ